MHMADALLSPEIAVGMYAASAVAAGVSIAHIRKQEQAPGVKLTENKMPTMAVMSALVFAGQMVNYTIPGTGASGHICGGMLLTSVLGPYAGFLSMIAVLAIQCLFFADGGLMALGANIWNMAFYGCFVGYYLIYRPIMRGLGVNKNNNGNNNRRKIVAASLLGCVITLQLGSFSVVLETMLSGITDIPFSAFVTVMQPIHFIIGLIEGIITSAVLIFIYEARPELLQDIRTDNCKQAGLSFTATIVVLAAVTLAIGGGLSLLASSNPDGLEWSIAKIGAELSENTNSLQEATAFLPDYEHTSLSGIVGAVITASALAGLCIINGLSSKTIMSHKQFRSGNRAENAKNEFKAIDELTSISSPIHRLPPLVKLIATVTYIIVVMSFNKYNIFGLLPMVLIPLVLYVLSHISIGLCFYKLRIVMPLVCAVGIVNPFIDKAIVAHIGSFGIRAGVISMITLMMKGIFSLIMSFLLVATTGIDHICRALRQLHCPKIICSLLLLTFRYIAVLLEEVAVMTTAYHLRAPRQKGINVAAWGSFLGQLILRSMDRAEAIYNSMHIRGFNGEFYYAEKGTGNRNDQIRRS